MPTERGGDGAPRWVPLAGQGAPGPLVGGKGAWLDRLLAADLPVPPTAVITTAAYREVAATEPIAGLLADLATAAVPPPEHHARARHRVDRAFAEVELPTRVAEAVAAAHEAADGHRGPVAARSSATAEDLHGTSFAGQYRSFLDLADGDALERAVRLVWASLWHPAPRAYRRYHGVDVEGLAMAVVVMRQIPARSAGVAFTVDPGGAPDVVRIEAVEGLGEQLVSGAVTPSVHLVPRAVARGTPAPGGETTRTDLDRGGVATSTAESGPDQPPGPVVEVAALALEVEDALGGPQDLEWARDDHGLWLLQARPITTTARPERDDGFDTPGLDDHRWTTTGIAEMLPGVLPPLRWEVCHLALEEALRSHESHAGLLDHVDLDGRQLLGRVRGRAAVDADLLDQIDAEARAPAGRIERLRRTVRDARVRRRALWESGTATVAAVELAELLPDDHALAPLPSDELLALRRRLIDLLVRAMTAEAAVAATAVGVTRRLETTLARHLGPDEARTWVGRVTTRPGGTTAGWPRTELRAALEATTPGALVALAEADDLDDARRRLDAVPGGTDLLDEVGRTLRRAGSTAVPAGPTWDEVPEQTWPAVRQLAELVRDGRLQPPPDPAAPTPLDDLLDGLAAHPDWRRTRILTLQVVDLRRAAIRWMAEDAGDLLERRERAKAAVLSIGGAVRRVQLALGRRLQEGGLLEAAVDVELLTGPELAAATRRLDHGGAKVRSTATRADEIAVPSLAELGRRRHQLVTLEAAGPLPAHFTGWPHPTDDRAAEGDVLTGWGASPGQATGPARALRSAEGGGLERGEVLVAQTTDASWAPLFMVASAVIVEEGGPLSHAAIVARELGIPAVLNVPGIVARIEAEAVTVTVDGDRGTVTIGAAGPAVASPTRSARSRPPTAATAEASR